MEVKSAKAKETKKVEPPKVEKVEEVEEKKTPEVTEKAVEPIAAPKQTPVVSKDVPIEEKILSFVESSPSGNVSLNSFLNSVYAHSLSPMQAQIVPLKNMKGVLAKLANSGKLKFLDERYLMLGKTYYKGDNPGSNIFTLKDVEIVAIKK